MVFKNKLNINIILNFLSLCVFISIQNIGRSIPLRISLFHNTSFWKYILIAASENCCKIVNTDDDDDDDEDEDDEKDDEIFLWYGWPTKGV